MFTEATRRKLWRAVAVLGASGMLFGSSCSSDQVQAIAAGIGAAADQIGSSNHDDISFGDWLRDEVRDW